MDDLIFSGAGSGCRGDDEDECTPPFESGSGDDLITPVYVPPTKQPNGGETTANGDNNGKKSGATGGGDKAESGATGTERTCDDEDCLHGSGDSAENTGVGTESFTPGTTRGGSGGELYSGYIKWKFY